MKKTIVQNIILPLFFATLLEGCATFYSPQNSNEQSNLISGNQTVVLEILLTIKGYHGKTSTSDITEVYSERNDNAFDYEKLERGIEQTVNIFKRSGGIGNVVIGKRKAKNINLKLHYVYDGEYDSSHYSWQWLTAVTVGLVPFWQKRNVKLTAELLDSRGEVKKSYRYLEEATDVKHLFLLPLALFYQSDSATKEMVENVTNQLVADLKKDKII